MVHGVHDDGGIVGDLADDGARHPCEAVAHAQIIELPAELVQMRQREGHEEAVFLRGPEQAFQIVHGAEVEVVVCVDQEVEAILAHAAEHFRRFRFCGAFDADGRSRLAVEGAEVDWQAVEIQVLAACLEFAESEREGDCAIDERKAVGGIEGDGRRKQLRVVQFPERGLFPFGCEDDGVVFVRDGRKLLAEGFDGAVRKRHVRGDFVGDVGGVLQIRPEGDRAVFDGRDGLDEGDPLPFGAGNEKHVAVDAFVLDDGLVFDDAVRRHERVHRV